MHTYIKVEENIKYHHLFLHIFVSCRTLYSNNNNNNNSTNQTGFMGAKNKTGLYTCSSHASKDAILNLGLIFFIKEK